MKAKASAPSETAVTEQTEAEPFISEPFGFDFEGKRYAGLLDQPPGTEAAGLVVFVHGSGRSHVSTGRAYMRWRKFFAQHGLATYAYDKSGNGDSEGEFDSEQPVENSAGEVTAAIRALRDAGVAGADRIGLWSLSRGGWTAPLVIKDDQDIDFWISVSAAGPLSNMQHLMTSNWRLRGYDEDTIETLLGEWHEGFAIQLQGGTYEAYVAATPNLMADPFMTLLRGEYTQERYLDYARFLQDNPPTLDPETGLVVFIDDMDEMLRGFDLPVLAQLGEADTQIDWRETKRLYEETIGRSGNLTVATFPDCNHFMEICEDCGFGDKLEKVTRTDTGDTCPGHFQSMAAFLADQGFPEL